MDDDTQPPTFLPPAPPVDPPVEAVESPPPRRGRGIAIVAGIVAALAVAGGAAAFLLLRGSGEQLLDKIPADTDAFVTIYLDPAAGQKVNLLRLADEIPSLGSGDKITDQIDGFLDDALSTAGLTRVDLDWVGSQVAITVNLPESGSADEAVVAALIATDDESAASATLTKLREGEPSVSGWRQEDHGGVEVWVGSAGPDQVAYAIVDGVVVVANSAAAVDDMIAATDGESDTLAESASFQEATSDLPAGKLALFYANARDLAGALGELSGAALSPTIPDGTQTLEAFTGMAMSVSAEEDGLAVDTQVTFDPEALSADMREVLTPTVHENPLLEGVPPDALMVVSQEGLRATLGTFVEQLREFSPLSAPTIDDGFVDALTGDVAVAAMPTGTEAIPSGVVMIGTDDEAGMEKTIRSVVNTVPGSGRKWTTQDHEGVRVTTLVDPTNTSPFAFSYAAFDGAGVLGMSPHAVFAVIDALQTGSSISDSETYRDAMSVVPAGSASVYVDIDGFADAIRSQLPPEQVADFDDSVGATLDRLDVFVSGTESTDTSSHMRMFLRVV